MFSEQQASHHHERTERAAVGQGDLGRPRSVETHLPTLIIGLRPEGVTVMLNARTSETCHRGPCVAIAKSPHPPGREK